MVLNGFCRFFGIFLLAIAGVNARGAITGVLETMTVHNADCPLKVRPRWKKEWKPFVGSIPAGTVVKAVRPHDQPELALFQVSWTDDFYQATWACMFAESTEEITRDEKTYSGWHLSLHAASWRESLTYTDASENSYTIPAETLGVCPGDGYMMRWDDFDVGFTGCLFYGKLFANDQSGLGYQIHNLNTLAFMAGPEGLWRPSAGALGFGLYLPLLMRFAFLPEPATVTVQDFIAYKIGVLAEVRLERGHWAVTQRAGILGSFSNLAWSLGVSRDFR